MFIFREYMIAYNMYTKRHNTLIPTFLIILYIYLHIHRYQNVSGILVLGLIDFWTLVYIHHNIVLKYDISWFIIILSFIGFTILISPIVYIHCVYLKPWLSALFGARDEKNGRGVKKSD